MKNGRGFDVFIFRRICRTAYMLYDPNRKTMVESVLSCSIPTFYAHVCLISSSAKSPVMGKVPSIKHRYTLVPGIFFLNLVTHRVHKSLYFCNLLSAGVYPRELHCAELPNIWTWIWLTFDLLIIKAVELKSEARKGQLKNFMGCHPVSSSVLHQCKSST